MDLNLDIPTKYVDGMAHNSAALNKQKYMDNFAITF